jgi:hypothetical protein
VGAENYSEASSNANLSNPDSIICVDINVKDYLPIVKGPVICGLLNMMKLRTKTSHYVEWYKRHLTG